MNKIILGLDLGTNSIGWALNHQSLERNRILASGCRIIPMSQDELSNFDKGQSQSPTAERTRLRTMRRLRERKLLRRERLHRILNLCGFLPNHYATQIDFVNHPGKFLPGTEPKLSSLPGANGKPVFYFMDSFLEMVQDFAKHQPQLVANGKSIPFNWTIYFLRKKALTQKISKEELAWLLLHFNQKRGYNQLREEEEDASPKKQVEYKSLLVTKVVEEEKKKDETWYAIHLENGFVYKRKSKSPINWEGSYRDFIVTTDLNEDGTVKTDKYGKESRSLRAPSADDWTLLKKKTEADLEQSNKTPGEYIYDALLQNPSQKIKGRLINVIERKYYKEEIQLILEKQAIFHPEFSNSNLYRQCLEELYPHNINHRNHLQSKDLTYLFIEDILFYQRPLKSKKSLISNCRFEFRLYKKDGEMIKEYLKCIPSSHPLFQEFRLWNFIQRLRIFEKEKQENGRFVIDDDVTDQFLGTPEQKADLFSWLNERKEIDEKALLKFPGFKLGKNIGNYRWNYLSDKKYPANETRAIIKSRLKLVTTDADNFLTKERETSLWHILYSVENKTDLEKALKTFATKHNLDLSFVEQFRRFPPFDNDYGAYSQKSLNKLLPLLRTGKYWNENDIDSATRQRIDHLLNAVEDETISEAVRKHTRHLSGIGDFKGLPEWLATSIVYNRHAESDQAHKWEKPEDIQLVPQHSLRNPIVEKIVNETLRVVRDIWIEYGQSQPGFFQEIHVELGREMKNPNDKRKQITEQNRVNENTHLRLKALLVELMNDGTFENVRPHSPMQLEILKLYEEGALSNNDVPEDIAAIAKLPQPSNQQLLKYKLWLQQRYRSPYTGAIIPLTRLFTRDYDIEHIIPRSRFFDDSFSNKVICERIINSEYKDNRLAYEFISQKGGTPVPELSNGGRPVSIFTLAEYEHFIKSNYAGNRSKLKRLMMAEIPESFIQRQLNDSRYISKLVKQLLSNIVREQDEVEATSKNLLVSNGSITSTLRQHWGLNDIWSQLVAPRFERMNSITNSNDYGQWVNKEGKKYFQSEVPLSKQKNFSKKRIDHRHHALDAIIVACTTRNHINYMNNAHAADKGNTRYDLRQSLCEKKHNQPGSGDYSWHFKKPWESFTEEVKSSLQNIIPSFRQQVVILTRARNKHLAWRNDEQGNLKKVLVTQKSPHHWAIRKPLHKATVSGRVELASIRQVRLIEAISQWENIVDKKLRSFIKTLISEGYDDKQLVQYFKKAKNLWNGKDISKVDVHFRETDYTASRKALDDEFDKKKISKVTSPSIQNILLKHLAKYDEGASNELKGNPEQAFSPEGLEDMNRNIIELNGGKPHAPIYKVRLAETIGFKFQVGQSFNSRHKYVEAESGTNLFFGIYINEKGKRVCETIRLDMAIERQKQGLSPVPESNVKGYPLLFSLSPNDLVYVPDEEEVQSGRLNFQPSFEAIDVRKIYKIVSFTGGELLAVPCHVAKPISDGQEFTTVNKLQVALNGLSIRGHCFKLFVNRLGQVKKIIPQV